MSGHVHDLLALAAAGALDADEAARVEAHARECRECAAAADAWQRVAEELRRLPAPRASGALAARTRTAVEQQLARQTERAWARAALGFLVAFAWTLAVAAWLVADLVRGELALRLGTALAPTAAWYGGYVLSGWIAAGAAALLLGRRAPSQGRIA
jgi:anti-sigma factor RsiW